MEDRLECCPTQPLAFIWSLVLYCPSLLAQTTNGPVDPDAIPPFRPAKPELSPTFWEHYGVLVILGMAALLLLAAVVWRIIANRPPPPQPTPAETARAALASLLHAGAQSKRAAGVPPAEHSIAAPPHATSHQNYTRSPGSEIFARDAGSTLNSATGLPRPHALADQVSAILRRYFVEALCLPVPQLTNRELAGELCLHSKLTPDLRQSAPTFLLALDQCRFNPVPDQPVTDAVQTARSLVDQTEAALHPPKPRTPAMSNA